MHSFPQVALLAPTLAFLLGSAALGFHPSQGLWVGEVSLNAVNEATGAVGDSNTYEFSNPEIPTPTSDTAFLRLILHVNGAGQVSLLKSAAIVERETFADGSTDILLITDPSLYPQYPGIAKRIASAFYDFGDQQAVTAVQTLIDSSTANAVTRVIAATGGSQSVIEAAVLADLQGVVNGANVNSAYLNRGTGASSFITNSFFSEADVDTIANEVARLIHIAAKTPADFAYNVTGDAYNPFPTDPLGGNFAAVVATARALRNSSFYKDTRGLEAIAGVVVAAANAAAAEVSTAPLATKQSSARLAAQEARHNAADVTQAYNRFLASASYKGMKTVIPNPAVAAALDARGRGKNQLETIVEVKNALLLETTVGNALTEAVTLKSASLWSDNRAENAANYIINSAADAAATQVFVSTDAPALKQAIEDALATAYMAIKSAPVFAGAPSSQYAGFVTDASYQAAAATAAKTATSEAIFQYGAGVTGSAELTFLTKRAVNKALAAARNTAAALPQSSIPLRGSLAAGGSLSGVIHLPALAPTNPFMHRRHPDHTEGFPITRNIALTVDVPEPGDSERAGYGVSRISGSYNEELFGLHKPLGPNKNVGLRTKGTFTLNRLSFADSLNF